MLASATGHGKAYLWHLPRGEHARIIPPQIGLYVTATALSENGGRLATIVGDALTIWDTGSGHDLLRHSHRGEVLNVALHGDQEAFVAEPEGIRVYELRLDNLKSRAESLIRTTPRSALEDCSKYLTSPAACEPYWKMSQQP